MKIAFIGGGNMAGAMLSGIIDNGVSAPPDISVSDIDDTRRHHLEQTYGVTVTGDNCLAAGGGEVVVLAIKPQNSAEVMAGLSGRLQSNQLVLSIMAGITIDTLRRGLNHDCLVRVMPNTPARIGESMSVWTATPNVTGQQREWAGSILGAMGKEIYVDDEDFIDMATAVSGSGPAYFFLFVEALVEAAIHVGLPRDTAQQLVLQTMLGSGHLMQKSDQGPAELRSMVTSPGGTTARALDVFEQANLRDLVRRAVSAAYARAKELGGR